METMMNSVSAFQISIKDIHARIDAMERRQTDLEKNKSSQTGATSALTALVRDFAIPVLAIAVAWLVARNEIIEQKTKYEAQPLQEHHSSLQLK